MFICNYIFMCTWVYTSEATAKRIRERYLKAILRQDITFFDTVGPGEVTARIQTDTRRWSRPFNSRLTSGLPMLDTCRFGPSRHIREGSSRCQLHRFFLYRFHCGIPKQLAAGSGHVFHFSLDGYLRRPHEQIRFQVYPVRFTSPRLL
jgi:ABC-type multidrug transport system fused ATPase/permease subunit